MTDQGPSPRVSKDLAPRTLRQKLSRAKKNIFVAFFVDLVVIVATALVLSLLVKTFLLRSFFIPSSSMESTLMIDDRIIVNELVPDVIPLERGDVVVFQDPGNWLGSPQTVQRNPIEQIGDFFLASFGLIAPDSQQHLVKRVIGTAGDHIVCAGPDAKLQINGVEITEPYINKGARACGMAFDVTVPAHSIWAMGDNRDNSTDSRYHQDLPSKGFVDLKYVVGRAFVVSFPFNHWAWLDNYPNVHKDIPKP
jgi:signal peptidase I